jgi:hypothetical protein
MSTVINNPTPVQPANSEGNSGNNLVGTLFGLLGLLLLGYLFFMYALPMIRQPQQLIPKVEVPNKIDVHINREE